MQAVNKGTLNDVKVEFSNEYACCVVMASGGYPVKYNTGYPIDFGKAESLENITIFHAGTKLDDGKIVTSGGRVLGVTAVADTAGNARDKAYEATKYINFRDCHYRSDIGKVK